MSGVPERQSHPRPPVLLLHPAGQHGNGSRVGAVRFLLMKWRYAGWYLLLVCQFCLCQTSAQRRAIEPADSQLYRNRAAGFCYTIPLGWVDRTKEMSSASEDADSKSAAPRSEVLLPIFERPPQVKVSDLNSTVVIAREPVNAYQGLKSAADYFEPLAEVTAFHGLHMEGDPYEVVIDNRHLARGDFSKQ